jgi:hypothetical protein
MTKTYLEWCHLLERQYDTMPLWYWDDAKRKAAFDAYAKASEDRKEDKK